MIASTLLILASIGMASFACQWLAWRLRIPAILLLLAAGILLGPVLSWLNPDRLFGDLLFPLVSLSVAVILFEGSLTLRFDELKGHGKMVRNLIPAGTLITWAIGTLSAHWALGLSWSIALLFGAIIVVSGPTVIMPLLHAVRPTARLANVLRWEGIVIDPVGALLAVLVFEGIVSTEKSHLISHALTTFGFTLLTGFVTGATSAWLLGNALRRRWLPHYLQNAGTLMLMLGAYGLSNEIAHESGLLTVTVMGIWLANMKAVPVDEILEFKESLTVLLLSGIFIILAARITFGSFAQLGNGLFWVLLALLLVARPLTVWISAIGSNFSWQEKVFLSWLSPRGIVAAAVSALFAFQLEQLGFTDADVLVPLVFSVIMVTVILQSLTARPAALLLKVTQPDDHGFLILGANPIARQIAMALKKCDIPVIVADTNWENIRLARMDNLAVYFGNPMSEHAATHLDLTGIGNLLVVSPYKQLNALATYHFLDWMKKDQIYCLSEGDPDQGARHKTAEKIQQTQGLFGEGITYAKLASLASQGYSIKSTSLSEAFTFEAFQKQHANKALLLFTLDERKNITPITAGRPAQPKAGYELISLAPPAPTPPPEAAPEKTA